MKKNNWKIKNISYAIWNIFLLNKIMKKTYIILVWIFIFGIGIFLWNKFWNFWENKNNFENIQEVLEEEDIIKSQYNQEVDKRIFHWGNYIQDNWIIKYRDEILKNVDIETFEYLTGSYAKDDRNYFFWGKEIYISDWIGDRWDYRVGKIFEILLWDYAKDEKYLYYQDYGFIKHKNQDVKIIPENSKNNYSKYFVKVWDEIFYWDQKQNKIDTNSFSYLKYNYFQDKNGIYFWNNLLTLSKKYYKIIDAGFIKDDRYVFLNGEYNPQLDAKSFKKLEVPENHMYFLELYSDINWFYSFNQYSHNFYKINSNISQKDIKKCLNNENFCKSVLWYE